MVVGRHQGGALPFPYELDGPAAHPVEVVAHRVGGFDQTQPGAGERTPAGQTPVTFDVAHEEFVRRSLIVCEELGPQEGEVSLVPAFDDGINERPSNHYLHPSRLLQTYRTFRLVAKGRNRRSAKDAGGFALFVTNLRSCTVLP